MDIFLPLPCHRFRGVLVADLLEHVPQVVYPAVGADAQFGFYVLADQAGIGWPLGLCREFGRADGEDPDRSRQQAQFVSAFDDLTGEAMPAGVGRAAEVVGAPADVTCVQLYQTANA